jgi:sugar phosphate isomerase/epimerase
MRLGVSSHTFVWAVGVPGFPQPARPLSASGLLDRAAELGVRVVQIADNLPLDRLPQAELQSLAAKAGDLGIDLEVGTCGIQPQHLLNYLRLATVLRSPLMRVVIDTEEDQPPEDAVVRSLRQVLPQYEQAGVTLAIENHDRFPAASLAGILQRCESPRVGVCLDTANSLGCGEDLHTVLRTLGRWVVNLHIKDFAVTRLPHKKGFVVEGRPAGAGQLDIPGLLAELKALGREANAILELWPPPEPTSEASIAKEAAWTRQSIDYLRRYITA